MPTNVVMPQMGESIAEGTIVRWIKKIGDPVDRDEPLFEISTDKVDAEIPSPAAGVLTDIRAKEGDTVPVNSVVAVIGGDSVTSAPTTTKASVARRTAFLKPPQDNLKLLAGSGRLRRKASRLTRRRTRARKTCDGRSPLRSFDGSPRSTMSTSHRFTGPGSAGA